LVFLLWPSSVALMVPHVWDSERAAGIFFGTIVALNSMLYAAVGFMLSRTRARVSTNKSWLRVATIVSAWASIVVITATTAVLGRPVFYRFPSEYRGWIVLEYANPSCSTLTSRGINQVVQIPSSGHFCTSSPLPMPDGLRRAMYEYTSNGVTRHLFPCHPPSMDLCVRVIASSSISEFPQRVMFVATPQEFREDHRTQDPLPLNAAKRRPSNEPLERSGTNPSADGIPSSAGRSAPSR
jgi:hypothetical protein